MPHVSGLGTIFAPGQAHNVNAASDAIDSTLTPGSNYFNSGNIGLGTSGTTGNALLNSTAALGQTQVGFDSTSMDNDQANLASLSNLYYGLAQKGGMAEAAARENALAQMANLGVGGAGAGQAITAGSGDITSKAADIAAQERANNAQGSTSAGAAAAATALQKAVYNAHVSHANHMTAIAAAQYQNQLAMMQAGYDEQLNNAAANARNQQTTAYQQANNTTRQAALTAAQTIASAGTTAGATISAMGSDTPQTYTTDAFGVKGGVNLGVPSQNSGNTGVSWAAAAQPSKLAVLNPFDTEAVGNTTTAPDPSQWSNWLKGSTLAP